MAHMIETRREAREGRVNLHDTLDGLGPRLAAGAPGAARDEYLVCAEYGGRVVALRRGWPWAFFAAQALRGEGIAVEVVRA